jgi:hypothetical protein
MVVNRDPNTTSLKSLQKQKLEGEIAESEFKRSMREQFGAGGGVGSASFGSGNYAFNPYTDKFEETPDSKLQRAKEKKMFEYQQKLEYDKQKPLSGEAATKFGGARQSAEQVGIVKGMTNEDNFGRMKKGIANIRMARNLGLNQPGSIRGSIVQSMPIVGPIAKHLFKTDDQQKKFELAVNLIAENNVRAKSGAAVPEPEQVREELRQLMSDDSFVSFMHRMVTSENYSRNMMEDIRPGSSQTVEPSNEVPNWVPEGFNYQAAKDAGYTDEEIKRGLLG